MCIMLIQIGGSFGAENKPLRKYLGVWVLVTARDRVQLLDWLEINIFTPVPTINQFLPGRGDNLIPSLVILNLLRQKQDQLLEM